MRSQVFQNCKGAIVFLALLFGIRKPSKKVNKPHSSRAEDNRLSVASSCVLALACFTHLAVAASLVANQPSPSCNCRPHQHRPWPTRGNTDGGLSCRDSQDLRERKQERRLLPSYFSDSYRRDSRSWVAVGASLKRSIRRQRRVAMPSRSSSNRQSGMQGRMSSYCFWVLEVRTAQQTQPQCQSTTLIRLGPSLETPLCYIRVRE